MRKFRYNTSGMKHLIIYDLDGTLVDTLEDIVEAANHMLRRLGSPPLPARDIRGYVGRGVRQLIAHCLQSDDSALIERGMTVYRAHYARHLADHSRLYPGVRDTLEHFKTRRQAVVTNKPNPFSRDLLVALDIADYFLEIVGGEDGFPKKPDPASLSALMKREGIAAGDAMMVGDSPVDVEAGRRAGVMTVGIAHGFSERSELTAASPDALLDNFEEFLAHAKREGW